MKFFISYTTKDKEITREFLTGVSLVFRQIGNSFVDLIDNDSNDKQSRVFLELESSDYLVLINSQNVTSSNWVTRELQRAKQLGIPTIVIEPWEINLISREFLSRKLLEGLTV